MLNIPFLNAALKKLFRPYLVDDHVDRINYRFTSSLLCFFALTVSAKQYVGSPIQCWVPMEFRNAWEQYAEDICFIQNTYFVAEGEPMPVSLDTRKAQQISYYQWIPIVLALQALAFYLPNWIWKIALRKSDGVDMEYVLFELSKIRSMSDEKRDNEISIIAKHINKELLSQREKRSIFRCFSTCELYLMAKFLFVLNIVGQFMMLNSFIGQGYIAWGFNALESVWRGNDTKWHGSRLFPRISFCDFQIRQMGAVHGYTIQCVLMINMFNEKIYLFLWFWFIFVGLYTFANFFSTICVLFPSRLRERKIHTMVLLNSKELLVGSRKNIEQFVNIALRSEGILLVHFIEQHVGSVLAREIIAQLFEEFVQLKQNYEKNNKDREDEDEWCSTV